MHPDEQHESPLHEPQNAEPARTEDLDSDFDDFDDPNADPQTLRREELQRARAETARYAEEILRLRAEMDNLRKRAARDVEQSRRYALDRLLEALLPTLDGFEKGLEAATSAQATVQSLQEGTDLTWRMLSRVLEDHGLRALRPHGERFDPELHQAVGVRAEQGVTSGTVLEVMQTGYRLHERLIRPALVTVSS